MSGSRMSGVDGMVLDVDSRLSAEGKQAAALVDISLGSATSHRLVTSC